MSSEQNEINWNEFNSAINFLKDGVKELNFRDVIRAASGHNILPFDSKSMSLIKLIDKLLENNLHDLSDHLLHNYKGRANEFGNKIESEILKKLLAIPKIKCGKPKLANGKIQSSGYPDCLIEWGDIKIYADIKSYQSKTAESSLRSFFYQPTNKNKILFDAPHCIIGFETLSLGGDNKSPFKIIGYKIIDTYDLKVNFKAEFNAGNAQVYGLRKLNKPTF